MNDPIAKFVGIDMTPEDWSELEGLFDKFIEEEKQEPEHAEDTEHIEKHIGYKLQPSPTHRTEQGSAFWKSRDQAQDVKPKAAGIALVTGEGMALFLQRGEIGDHAGTWCFPGGGIEKDESPEEAAIRETREETGWIKPEDLDSEPDEVSENNGYVTFLQKINNEFIPTLDKESSAWSWAPLDKPPEPLHPGVKKTLAQMDEDELFLGKDFQPQMMSSVNSGIPAGLSTTIDDGTEDSAAENKMPKVDKSYKVNWMSELSEDGETMFADESLPDEITQKSGKTYKLVEPLKRHEKAEWDWMQTSLAEFKEENDRDPNDKERQKIYTDAHNKAGTPSEKRYCEENDIDWDEHEAWCRGKLSQLERQKNDNPPPDPDVKIFPHGKVRDGGSSIGLVGDMMLAFDASPEDDDDF